MDPNRFDALVRAAGRSPRPPSRRTLLRSLGGGALSALLVPAFLDEADARKKKKKPKKCKAGQKRCGAKCVPQTDCCKDVECDRVHREGCYQGRCGCGTSEIRDSKGYCGPFPNCKSTGLICTSNGDCCSGRCTIDDGNGQRRCDRGDRLCILDLDCNPGLQRLGWMCD
jgi:hypothetical protein